jgi:aldehyde dehydrogenase (NAD+)
VSPVQHRSDLFISGDWVSATGGEVADPDRGVAVAERVRAGTFGINQGYSMDPAAPFGGVKASGYGRELGPEGLDAYLHTKAISIARERRT